MASQKKKFNKLLAVRKRTWLKIAPVKIQLDTIKGCNVPMDQVVDFLYRMANLDMRNPLESDPRVRETLRLMDLESGE